MRKLTFDDWADEFESAIRYQFESSYNREFNRLEGLTSKGWARLQNYVFNTIIPDWRKDPKGFFHPAVSYDTDLEDCPYDWKLVATKALKNMRDFYTSRGEQGKLALKDTDYVVLADYLMDSDFGPIFEKLHSVQAIYDVLVNDNERWCKALTHVIKEGIFDIGVEKEDDPGWEYTFELSGILGEVDYLKLAEHILEAQGEAPKHQAKLKFTASLLIKKVISSRGNGISLLRTKVGIFNKEIFEQMIQKRNSVSGAIYDIARAQWGNSRICRGMDGCYWINIGRLDAVKIWDHHCDIENPKCLPLIVVDTNQLPREGKDQFLEEMEDYLLTQGYNFHRDNYDFVKGKWYFTPMGMR
jgi:hypothetical protein